MNKAVAVGLFIISLLQCPKAADVHPKHIRLVGKNLTEFEGGAAQNVSTEDLQNIEGAERDVESDNELASEAIQTAKRFYASYDPARWLELNGLGPKSKQAMKNSSMSEEETVKDDEVYSESDLARFLFNSTKSTYLPTRRPVKDARDSMTVWVGITPVALNEMLEKEAVMVMTSLFTLQWKDQYLVWNTTKFAKIGSLAVQPNEIFFPDITLVNSGKLYVLQQYSQIMPTVSSDGSVEFIAEGTTETFCEFNLLFFPFDEQTCHIRFECWTYFPAQQMFDLYDPPVEIQRLAPSEQWTFLNWTAHRYISCYTDSMTDCCYSGLDFAFTFRRKAAFYNNFILIPSFIISIVELVTFTLPTPETVKIHISFTCLLAYSVFQTTVNKDMPRTSENVPYLSIYIDLQMAFIAFALFGEAVVFMCLTNARIYRKMPPLLHTLSDFLGQLFWVDAGDAENAENQLEVKEGYQDRVLKLNEQKDDIKSYSTTGFMPKWLGAGKQRRGPSTAYGLPPDKANYKAVFGLVAAFRPGRLGGPDPNSATSSNKPLLDNNGNNAGQGGGAGLAQRRASFSIKDQTKELAVVAEEGNKEASRHLQRLCWLYFADVVERITFVTYTILIIITPIAIFKILPANTNHHSSN